MGVSAWFKFTSAGFKLHFALRDEVGRNDIPAAEDRRLQQFLPAFFHIKNSGARWTQHPFLRPGAEKINVRQGNWKSTQRLDSVHGEENTASRAKRADRFQINAITAAIVGARQRHQPRPLRQRTLDD